jgi:hypothetical protein
MMDQSDSLKVGLAFGLTPFVEDVPHLRSLCLATCPAFEPPQHLVELDVDVGEGSQAIL